MLMSTQSAACATSWGSLRQQLCFKIARRRPQYSTARPRLRRVHCASRQGQRLPQAVEQLQTPSIGRALACTLPCLIQRRAGHGRMTKLAPSVHVARAPRLMASPTLCRCLGCHSDRQTGMEGCRKASCGAGKLLQRRPQPGSQREGPPATLSRVAWTRSLVSYRLRSQTLALF